MAFKDLSPRQMVHISAAWLDPEHERPTLLSLKRCAPLLDDIEAVHAGVLSTLSKQKKANDELTEIQNKQLSIDQLHDRKARGAHAVLTGFADLADDPEEAARYLQIRTQLFTDGLRFISASYGAEACEVRLARERLTPESKGALKALPTPGGSLLNAVQAWFTAGDELGELEARRAQLEAEGKEALGDPQGGQLQARNRWIKVVRSLLQVLELEEPDTEIQRQLLAPLQRELERAERRRSTSKNDEGTDLEDDAPEAPGPRAAPAPGEGQTA